MQRLYGNKLQYYDSEYDNALDEGIFESKKDAIRDKYKRYTHVEELLSTRDKCIWRECLQLLYKPSPTLDNDLHKLWKLQQQTVQEWFGILARADPKIRTVTFVGRSNSGKSLIAKALTAPFAPGYIQRDGGTNVHWLENLYRKSVILFEEPSIHMSNIEDLKLVFGGERIIINRKNKQLIDRPPGPAVIVTTNKEFWHYDPEPLLNRMRIYTFDTKVDSIIPGYIENESVIRYLCDVYDGRYNNKSRDSTESDSLSDC